MKLVITKENELKEVNNNGLQKGVLTVFAKILSYLFHPVFVPVYVVLFLLFVEPFLFVGFNKGQKIRILLQAVQMYTFFPLVSIILLRTLNFIPSIKLEHKKDRIIPFIICNIWYFWIWYVWRNLPEVPVEMVVFAMSIFLASSIGLLFNIYIKISMHGIALGTAVAFLASLGFMYQVSFGLYFTIAVFIAGLVSTARLILSDHQPSEIYWGLAAGVLAMLLSGIIYSF
ncbi:MAG TPA: hypothetical protein PK110_08700 [Niabella sp.]|nr:hypothetical protein [Chitinophagaceae bacterium]HRN46622.1 hypothetical protein [Niabella sp.]HRO84884.1 hypothetical protein [Niabella sp.]HUN01289.1 hypothetical protein [Niabella sp.]